MTIKQQGGIFGRNPTFNQVTAQGANDPLVVDRTGSDGDLIVFEKDGTQVGSIQSRSGLLSQIILDPRSGSFQGSGIAGSGEAIVPMDHSQQADAHTSLGNGVYRWKNLYLSGNVIVASGSGIDFSATSGTGTSELFSDYEEGNWTPVVADAASGGNTQTPSGAVSGIYTKIGNMVHAQCRVVNIDTTGLTSGNALFLQGLPFTSSSSSGSFAGSVELSNVTIGGTGCAYLLITAGSDALKFRELTSGSSASNISVSSFTSGTADVFATFTYTAA